MKELLQKLSDGTMTADDAKRLNDLLRGNPEACEVYLNHITLEAQLQREVASAKWSAQSPVRNEGQESTLFTDARRSPLEVVGNSGSGKHTLTAQRIRFAASQVRTTLAAVAAIALAFIAWLSFMPATAVPLVATVLLAEDCVWKQPQQVNEGAKLAVGALRLESGLAIVRFDGGAEVVLRGETELELQSAAQARLLRGVVVERAANEAAGFKLLTPTSELTDLGTEFAVKVERDGATELHVLEGEVAYGSAVANAGDAFRFEDAKLAPQPVALNAPRFDELLRKANPRERPDLMTVYEGFHYDAGSYEPAQITKGKGWAGPWRLREADELRSPNETDTTTEMNIVHGKLTVPWPVEGGRLGGLEMPAGRTFRVRQMRHPVDLHRDSITYFSLMTQEPDHSQRNENERPQEGVRLTFRSSADYWGEALSFGIGGQMRPVVNNGLGVWTLSAASIPDEQSLLWIGKIVSRADGEDEISFRIYGQDDALDYAEPPAWHVVTRGLRMNARLDLVLLSAHGTSPRIVDELRIGPTWRSVVPIQISKFAAR